MDGTIKSDDESCISVKCATPICLSYYISLCERGDLHLRGTCENLLVTLIQTTIHLLTLSSLSNSFNNSFFNQCSLVSTNSKDSSSHAFTIIGIKLLEDSIQHTTSSSILAKFALAQLMDDIDFRILTYLEQQLKQQYPDIHVRQAIASTFANKRKNVLKVARMIQHFIYCIAEFLVMLSHDTLHSKRVIKIQDLIKHNDSLLTSGHEPETHTLAALEPVLYDFFSCSSYANN
ncbi:unnamed protein product [Rotaria sp. Silwood1]|nr:unnamed protein product [Rotaria sp. Silwood1]